MRGIGYWWDVVSRWSEGQFNDWLSLQSRKTLVAMLQETDPNGCWADEEARIEIGRITPLRRARKQMKTFWEESRDGDADRATA